MKIKNIQLTTVILASLIVASFAFYVFAENNTESLQNIFLDSDQDGLSDQEEKAYGTDPHNKDTDNDGYSDGTEVQSGYNPLKPAPGDKLIPENQSIPNASNQSDENNLTQQLTAKIKNLTNESMNQGGVTVETVQSLIDETIGSDSTAIKEEAPQISKDDIKIKEQNYDNLSKEKAFEKRKEDMTEYLAAIFYIMSSNSPEPITSNSDISSAMSKISQQIISSLTTRSTKELEILSESGEKMLEQIKEVEVPEEMVDFHIKAMSFALYAQEMKNYINPNSSDPIADIQNLSKIGGLLSNAITFSEELENKISEYGLLSETEEINQKIEEFQNNSPEK